MPAEPTRFAELFNAPSVEAMYGLTPREFERFVAFVLQRAGYDAKEVGPHFLRGVDVEMRLPGKARIFGGVECKKYASDRKVRVPVVRGVRGASAVSASGAKPFVITTSDCVDEAHQEAYAAAKKVYLLNGAQFVRYINYVRGSRHDDDNTITSLSPEFFAGKDVPLSHPRTTRILTIANNKGGVGKTTTTYYLGSELARLGKRVLLVDLDAQANLTEWCFNGLAAEQSDDTERIINITQYFSGQRALHEMVTPTGTERLSIIPSDPFLRLRDLGGSGRPDIEKRFVGDLLALCTQDLPTLEGAPDWVIIDTPPAMSVFTRAALAAAHYVLAPIRPRNASITGTQNMMRTLRTMNALTDNRAEFLGMIITHWDKLVLSQRFEQVSLPRASSTLNGEVFSTRIPIDNQLEEVHPGAKTGGARAYAELAEEVLQHVDK